jgi:hypothetical protein
VVLYNEEVLVHLKSTNGHAMHNVLKHKQSLIDVIRVQQPRLLLDLSLDLFMHLLLHSSLWTLIFHQLGML